MTQALRKLAEQRNVKVDEHGGICIDGVWYAPKMHQSLQVRFASGDTFGDIRRYLRTQTSTYKPLVRVDIGEHGKDEGVNWVRVYVWVTLAAAAIYYLYGVFVQYRPPFNLEAW